MPAPEGNLQRIVRGSVMVYSPSVSFSNAQIMAVGSSSNGRGRIAKGLGAVRKQHNILRRLKHRRSNNTWYHVARGMLSLTKGSNLICDIMTAINSSTFVLSAIARFCAFRQPVSQSRETQTGRRTMRGTNKHHVTLLCWWRWIWKRLPREIFFSKRSQ